MLRGCAPLEHAVMLLTLFAIGVPKYCTHHRATLVTCIEKRPYGDRIEANCVLFGATEIGLA